GRSRIAHWDRLAWRRRSCSTAMVTRGVRSVKDTGSQWGQGSQILCSALVAAVVHINEFAARVRDELAHTELSPARFQAWKCRTTASRLLSSRDLPPQTPEVKKVCVRHPFCSRIVPSPKPLVPPPMHPLWSCRERIKHA